MPRATVERRRSVPSLLPSRFPHDQVRPPELSWSSGGSFSHIFLESSHDANTTVELAGFLPSTVSPQNPAKQTMG